MEKTLSEARTAISAYAPALFKLKIRRTNPRSHRAGRQEDQVHHRSHRRQIDVSKRHRAHLLHQRSREMRPCRWFGTSLPRRNRQTYLGKVVRLAEFGAFVELFPAPTASAHQRNLRARIRDVRDELKLGDPSACEVLSIEGNKVACRAKPSSAKPAKAAEGRCRRGGTRFLKRKPQRRFPAPTNNF